jgi:DNA-binding response OmpR family regulator
MTTTVGETTAVMASENPILVVDDDESILDLLEMVLEDEGYSVVLARNGADALDKLERIAPALILLDMRMPEMDGWQFAEAYRQAHTQVAPIVVITAASDAAERAAQIAADGYLGKPFDLDELVAVVGRHVRNGAA